VGNTFQEETDTTLCSSYSGRSSEIRQGIDRLRQPRSQVHRARSSAFLPSLSLIPSHISTLTLNSPFDSFSNQFQELRRQERVHVQERGKLTKDNSVAKTALSKATSARNKLEQLARELQKENKKLREETKKLAGLVEEARDEIESIKQEVKAVRSRPGRAFPLTSGSGPGTGDLILKVVCKGRAEVCRLMFWIWLRSGALLVPIRFLLTLIPPSSLTTSSSTLKSPVQNPSLVSSSPGPHA
jgi:hypothetical protein